MLEWVALCWLLLWVCRRRLAACAPRGSGFRVSHSLFCVSVEFFQASSLIQKAFDPLLPWRSAVVNAWFNLGVYFLGLGQILSSLMLLYFTTTLLVNVLNQVGLAGVDTTTAAATSAHSTMSSSDSVPSPSSLPIVPLIPGVNLPPSYLLVFWLATFISLAVHELGHAAAAAMERLQIQGFGVFFAFVFPGAYVRIEESLHYIPMWAQLKVYAAGVWNNVLLTLTCILLVPALPTLLGLGYVAGEGAVVASVAQGSGLEHALAVGDVITAFGGLAVTNSAELLQRMRAVDSSLNGFVMAPNKLSTLRDSWMTSQQHDAHAAPPPSLMKFDVVQMPGFCTSHNTLERLAASVGPHDRLECCAQMIAPWWLPDNTALSARTCFAHWRSTLTTSGARKLVVRAGETQRSESKRHQHLRSNHDQPQNEEVSLDEQASQLLDGETVRWWRNRHGQGDVAVPAHGGAEQEEEEEEEEEETQRPIFAEPDTQQSPSDATIPSTTLHCLPAREIVRSAAGQSLCQTDADCSNPLSGIDSKRICLRPLTTYPSTILTVTLNSGEIVLFEGTVWELSNALELTDLALRDWLETVASFSTFLHSKLLLLPSAIRVFFVLCAQISLSVAVLNMMPVEYFDGGHAFKQFARIMFPGQWRQFSDVTIKIANGLLIANLLSSVLPLLFQALQESRLGSLLLEQA